MSEHVHGSHGRRTDVRPARPKARRDRQAKPAFKETVVTEQTPEKRMFTETVVIEPPSEEEKRDQTEAEKNEPSTEPEVNHGNDQEADDKEVPAKTEDAAPEEPEPEEPHSNPEDFDSKSFLGNLSVIYETLQSDRYRTIDSNFPSVELTSMVSTVTTNVNDFKMYSLHSQQKLEAVRRQMKEIKDRIHKRIQMTSYDPRSAHERMSFEERELQAKMAQLNKDMAKAAEELARAAQVSGETESAAVEATIVAEQAAETARKIQEDYESRRKAEEEGRRLEQERRLAEERRRQEEAQRAEEARKAEEERRARLRREDTKTPAWESWPARTFKVDSGEFEHGIGCIVRGDPRSFQEDNLEVQSLDPLEINFTCADNEEMVGNIIRLAPKEEAELKGPLFVAMPHCTTRASAITREPVIKAEKGDSWVELKSMEVTFEDHKDLKFVQAEVPAFTNLAVVTRFKRDFLLMGKRGGKVASNVDQRVTFTAERGTFKKQENFVLQLQPVDSVSLAELKKKPECKALLNCSAIVTMEWTSKRFETPIQMTLPVPPNPVKAKKAAAARAAKEEKRKNPQRIVEPPPEPEPKQKKREKKQQQPAVDPESEEPKPREFTKWYMGQYGNNDDDENDMLYFVQKDGDRWHVVENMRVNSVRLDQVQFDLDEPIYRFMVVRTRTSVEATDARQMATTIENYLTQRLANVIVKQRGDDPNDIIVHVVPHNKTDRTLRQLVEEGYDEGPGASVDIILRESDVLQLDFRGNIQREDDNEAEQMTMTYNSNIATCASCRVAEVDRFLQRSYQVYRGFLQVYRRLKKSRTPTKEELEAGADPDELVVEYSKELLTELLISLPKDASPIESVVKVPIRIKSWSDAVNEDTLRYLAGDLGDDWQRLAYYLNIKRMRIQAIMRNNAQCERREEEAAFDMLLTWAKRVPRGMSKSTILINALLRSGREDLAEHINDLDREFKKRRNTLASA